MVVRAQRDNVRPGWWIPRSDEWGLRGFNRRSMKGSRKEMTKLHICFEKFCSGGSVENKGNGAKIMYR